MIIELKGGHKCGTQRSERCIRNGRKAGWGWVGGGGGGGGEIATQGGKGSINRGNYS